VSATYPSITFSYAEGISLNKVGLNNALQTKVLCQLQSIVSHIHQRGIAHGDIQLHNIVYDEKTQLATLIDFNQSHPKPTASHKNHDIYCVSNMFQNYYIRKPYCRGWLDGQVFIKKYNTWTGEDGIEMGIMIYHREKHALLKSQGLHPRLPILLGYDDATLTLRLQWVEGRRYNIKTDSHLIPQIREMAEKLWSVGLIHNDIVPVNIIVQEDIAFLIDLNNSYDSDKIEIDKVFLSKL
jgi:tRNA A-37 threonylcarbamoyl transferase component Bud32